MKRAYKTKSLRGGPAVAPRHTIRNTASKSNHNVFTYNYIANGHSHLPAIVQRLFKRISVLLWLVYPLIVSCGLINI